MLPRPQAPRPPVPWRTIVATIAAVAGALLAYKALVQLHRVLVWLLIAGFFAVVLSPAVDFLERKLKMRRAVATLVVFVVMLATFAALMYAFIRPLYDQGQEFADNFPRYVEEAKAGRGPIGGLVKHYNLDQKLDENKDRIRTSINGVGSHSLQILAGVGNAVAGTLTILVLAFLMILQGPKLQAGALRAMSPAHRKRYRAVAGDSARAITGYMAGNLLISVIAGVFTFIFLFAVDIPFRGVLALWTAFADLIPLVGATLGAVPAVVVAFLDSPVKGFAVIAFFVAYQQFENHVLQVTVMSRTVDLNPLAVLVSVLVGVDLFGLLGALLAIPVAGVIQVVSRDIYDTRQGRLKDEPTIGEEERPISEVEEPAAEETT